MLDEASSVAQQLPLSSGLLQDLLWEIDRVHMSNLAL